MPLKVKHKAIKMVQQATADGIRMLVEAQPNQEVIALKSLDSFVKAADGQVNKDYYSI